MRLVTGRTPQAEPEELRRTRLAPSSARPMFWDDLKHNAILYLMALPAILAIVIFSYGPMFGVVIAFQNYSLTRGVLGSEWVGLENFATAFRNPFFLSALRNSVIISAMKLAFGFPAGIVLALLLNEIRLLWFKRAVQVATMLPYFISWVVVATIFRSVLGQDGIVNEILQHVFGLPPVNLLTNPDTFRWMITFQDIWKNWGFSAMLYLAAISTIDPAIYEAAMVDGANRWQQAWYITLPGIRATIILLFILACGSLISAGFEQIYVMGNTAVASTGDIIETFTLRLGLSQGRYGLASAVGLFQAVVGLGLVLLANGLVKRARQEGIM
jgi:ABC-type polysaccharide transport system permease subunit